MTTKPSIPFADLLENGANSDLLREMIHHNVERVMQFDVENRCDAVYGPHTNMMRDTCLGQSGVQAGHAHDFIAE